MAQPPLASVIIEAIVLVFVTFVVIMLYRKYAQRKKTAALTLAVAFTFWDLAIICLFVFRLLAYLFPTNPYGINFSNIGINFGYTFSALSNVFIILFVAMVFSQAPLFRRTGILIPLIFGAFNGITNGLLISALITNFIYPTYDILPTMYHLIFTFISFGTLIIFAIRPLRQSELKWEKAGFAFIILSGVFGILVYLSFALDFLFGDSGLGIDPDGYTAFFYLAYVFGILMCSFAYL